MRIHTETTAKNLRHIRAGKRVKQEDLAALLGVPNNAVSKIETGSRSLTESEKKILDWFFFGTVPLRLPGPNELASALYLEASEWALISVLARRAGQTEPQWIAAQIRAYLVYAQLPHSGNGHTISEVLIEKTALQKKA